MQIPKFIPANGDNLKLLRYMITAGLHADHTTVNYNTGINTRLHKKYTSVDQGEILQVDYTDPDDADDVVVREEYSYSRMPNATIIDRTIEHTWFLEDGEPHEITKTTVKKYNSFQADKEGRDRRGRIKGACKLEVLQLILLAVIDPPVVDPDNPTLDELDRAEDVGLPYLVKHESKLNNFVDSGDVAIRDDIAVDPETWLDTDVSAYGYPPDTTIRDVILMRVKKYEFPE